jgi:hypothetical protein
MITSATNPKWEEFCASRNITNWKHDAVCWEGVKYIFAYRSSLHYVICDNRCPPVELLEALSLKTASRENMISSAHTFAARSRTCYLNPSPDATAFRSFIEALARLAAKKHFIETMELTEEEQAEIVI